MELFSWTEGEFSFFRGLQNPVAAFPLGLSSFEILGAGVLTLSYDFLASRFAPLSVSDRVPCPTLASTRGLSPGAHTA